MPKFITEWWPSALTALVILYATLWPDPVGDTELMIFPGFDKLIHAIMMGGLTGAIYFDRRRSGRLLTLHYKILVALCVAVFAIADEYLQALTNLGRAFEVWDILANLGGILIAYFTAPPVVNRIFRSSSGHTT